MNIDLDKFVEPLRQTCNNKVKANAVEQEYKKNDELKRSALRALSALTSIPKAGKPSAAVVIDFDLLDCNTRCLTKFYSFPRAQRKTSNWPIS